MLRKAILWLGFFITSGFRPGAYKRWKAMKEMADLQKFPPSYDEWFSPFLGLYIDLKLWFKTGHKVSWFNESFERLNYEENLWEFTKVAGVGWVRITGDMIHVRDFNEWGYEFTVNSNSNGALYVQHKYTCSSDHTLGTCYGDERFNQEHLDKLKSGKLLSDWHIAYREGIEIKSLDWVPAFEELVRQLDEAKEFEIKSLYWAPAFEEVFRQLDEAKEFEKNRALAIKHVQDHNNLMASPGEINGNHTDTAEKPTTEKH